MYRVDILMLFGLGISFLAFFLGLFFIVQKRLKNDNYLFLYISILILGFELFYKTLIHSKMIYNFTLLYVPGRFYNLLIYPVFLYFIWSVTKKKFKIKLPHFLLLLVFLVYSLYVFGVGLSISSNEKMNMLNAFYNDNRPGPFNYWMNTKTLIKSTIIPLLFLGVIIYDVFKFRKDNSNIKSKRLLNILTIVIVLYFLYNQLSNLIYIWIYSATQFSMIEWPIDIIFLTIIIILLSIMILMVNTGSTFLPAPKYVGSALQEHNYEDLVEKAKRLIKNNKLYKKEKFTLSELSKSLNTNSKYVSQAINHHLNLSFIDFINSYRVEEAKKQLLNAENSSLTLEAIGLMSGFKSKSAFFRAFKKATQLTPNQFVQSKQ